MATINATRRIYVKWYHNYSVRAYREFIKVFKRFGTSIDFDMMNEQNYKDLVAQSVDSKLLSDAYAKVYETIGSLHGRRTGAQILKQFKFFTTGDFMIDFSNFIIQWLHGDGSLRIVTIEKSYERYINDIIVKGLEDGKGIQEIARELRLLVNRRGFYRYQAERLARTESTTAANQGAMSAGRISGLVMDKIWLSATDARTRRMPDDKFDHIRMNEVRIRASEPFLVPSMLGPEPMMYPGDPKGSAGNVINCRCAVAMIAARDKNGDFIPI